MTIRYLFILSALSALVFACRKNYYDYTSVEYSLNVIYPDTYATPNVEGANVTLRNNVTGAVKEYQTGPNGSVLINDLVPGVYSVSISRTLSPEEAETLTGNRVEIFLNGTLSPLKISESGSSTIQLKGGVAGGFVIKEYYYVGVPSNYFYDGYIEIYNNSTDILYADSVCVGNTKTSSSAVYGFLEFTEYAYLQHVWMVPGSGNDHPVAPGESFIVAVDGINHKSDPLGNSNSPVNLGAGIADFETYFSYSANDADAADVPNMIHVYAGSTAGFDWLLGVNGTGMVVFKHPDPANLPTFTEPGTSATSRYIQIPLLNVLDGIDCVANASITPDKKRLPVTIDAGMTYVGATYNGKSVRRKIKTTIEGRKILMDTNNSSVDFEINDHPNPKGW